MRIIFKYIIQGLIFLFVALFRWLRWLTRSTQLLGVYIYTEWKRRDFKAFPSRFSDGDFIYPKITLVGGKFITVGKGTYIKKDSSLCAWNGFNGMHFSPSITIGADCGIGERAHITAINSITIGDGVLLGKGVTISDNSHGNTTAADIEIQPRKRMLVSKGAVVIENNVWIGDKATILAGVTIGEGSIVGANAVVVNDVPAHVVVAGNPAKIVKRIIDE